jgi:hypothetical protein
MDLNGFANNLEPTGLHGPGRVPAAGAPPAPTQRAGSGRRHERGMTMMGMLLILTLVGIIAYAGLRLVPIYLNYLKVARSMNAAAAEFKSDNPDPGAVRRSLDKHWQIEDISTVEAKDVEIVKDDGGVSLHVVYDDVAPYISDVSLSVHFDKTVKVQ